MQNFLEQFRVAMAAQGIKPPASIIADSKIHRFASNGRGSDDAGWYICHAGKVPAGAFGCWRSGVNQVWYPDLGRQLSPQEEATRKARMEDVRRAQKEEEIRRHAEAKTKAQRLWESSSVSDDSHAYLVKKKIKAHGLHIHEDSLVVPIQDENGVLHSLQFIYPDGTKRFLHGGRIKGCYYMMGWPQGTVYIAEGFATGATIHEITGEAVIVAFNAGNLEAAASACRRKFSAMRFVICADDDWQTSGNPGRAKATDAAKTIGGLLAVPIFTSDRPDKATDFNDMASLYGTDAVKEALGKAKIPDVITPTVMDTKLKNNTKSSETSTVYTSCTTPTADDVPRIPMRDRLLSIADRANIWKTPEGEPWATIRVNDHNEHHCVNSSRFKDWLLTALAHEHKINGRPASANSSAIKEAINAISARARICESIYEAPLRSILYQDKIYIDMGDKKWRTVEISSDGWRVIDTSPTPLARTHKAAAFPEPDKAGKIDALRPYIPNVSDDEFKLIVFWMLAALYPAKAFPILDLCGEFGSGKSTLARMLRKLTDPSNGDLLQPPKDDGDLISAARNNRVLTFDNLSSMKADLADSLCRLSTGAEIGGRKLYTDNDTAAFNASRPIIINGIPDLATRSDLASRTIAVKLSVLQKREDENDFWRSFGQDAPGIFGALLNALSYALRHIPVTETPQLGRMASFARLAVASAPALGWTPDGFVCAYNENIRQVAEVSLEGDVVASAVYDFMKNKTSWKGLTRTLFNELSGIVQVNGRNPDWPTNTRPFSDNLRRAIPVLRIKSLYVTVHHKNMGSWTTIDKVNSASHASPTSKPIPQITFGDAGDERDASSALLDQSETNLSSDNFQDNDEVFDET